MAVWHTNPQGVHEFCGGKNDWETAANVARSCEFFSLDDEDEQIAEEEISCYNCRYRRWTVLSFTCLKQKV